MPALPCPGLHHVTAICSDAQANVAFYAGVLGLRLVKRTVNFDDPGSYHLYYGDHSGRPGSLLTFFAWPGGARRGRPGAGQVAAVTLAVPAASLDFWGERLAARGVATRPEAARFDEPALAFEDPDGMPLELAGVAAVDLGHEPTPGAGGVPVAHAVRGVRAVLLSERAAAPTAALLTGRFGYEPAGESHGRTRFVPAATGGSSRTGAVDLLVQADAPAGHVAVGSVHHVAFRARDDAEQAAWRAELAAAGLGVSPVMDRTYFRSIYFREPGGVLLEIATDRPGFTVDEPLAKLGRALRLPAELESRRAVLERALPPLTVPTP